MNEILQKRIEEAARDFNRKEGIPYALIGHVFNAFIEGAIFALQNQWISVEEALPEENKLGDSDFVFVKTSIRFPFLACYSYTHKTWKDINHVAIHGITHWMEIPQLEGGEK